MTHFERVGTGNLTELRKPWLLEPTKRAARVLDLIDEAGITAFGGQESGTYLARACARDPLFTIVRAAPNSVVGKGRKRRERGNVLVLDERVWEPEGDPSDKTFEIPAGPVGRLSGKRTREIHQLRQRARHKETGEVVRFIVGHKPRNLWGYRKARREMDDWLRGDAYEWEEQGANVVLLFDGNGRLRPLRAMYLRAFVGPDSIVTSDHLLSRQPRRHPWRWKRVMDHKAAVSVEVGIPERRRGR